MRTISIALAVALMTTPAFAGGTKIKESLVPVVLACQANALCSAGACNNSGNSCTIDSDCYTCDLSGNHCITNADCNVGDPSPKSTVQLTGAGQAKISVKGILDASGKPVTTDGTVNTADDYILVFFLNTLTTVLPGFSLKLDLVKGSGKVTADFSSVLPPAGTPFAVQVALATPPDVPASCPGTNSAADIAARGNNSNCATGSLLGLGGFTAGP